MSIETEEVAQICKSLFPYHELHKLAGEFYLRPKEFGTVNPISFHQTEEGWIFRFQIGNDSLRYDYPNTQQCWFFENGRMEIELISSVGRQIEKLAALLRELTLTT